jgi:MFS transporter, DHA1 family, inner membrane transport protein
MISRALFNHRQFRYLGAFYLHSVTRLFAVSIFNIFTSIYVYQTFLAFKFEPTHALASTTLLFALAYLIQALGTAPALWLISKKGLRINVFYGSVFLVVYFVLLYLGKFDPIFFVLAAVASGVQISLYWTSYHIYFVELSDDKNQGEELSFSSFLSSIASIGGPAFGGLVINYGGYNAAFLSMTVMMILAALPLKFLPEQKNNIKLDILKVVQALSPKKELKSFLALSGVAISEIVNELFWPLFVFFLMLGFVGVGFMGSLVALVGSVTTIGVGLLIDKFGPKKVLNILAPLDSIVWSLKTVAVSPLQVFGISSVSGLTMSGEGMALDSEIYERARHNDIVAFIIQREIGLSSSKAIFLFVLGVLFWFGLPIVSVFVMAAAFTLLTRLYPFEKKLRNVV